MNRLIGIVALSVVAGGLSACGRGEDRPQAKAGEPIPVTVAPVATIDTAERLEAGGVVAARESAVDLESNRRHDCRHTRQGRRPGSRW